MLVAIMSDSHDHILNMRKALKMIEGLGISHVIHCGDLISPFMLKEMAVFPGSVHLVSGNNDGEQHLLTEYSLTQFKNIKYYGVLGKLKLDGVHLAFTHYYPMARGLISMDNYDLVCYGHSHIFKLERKDTTILLNPGEIMGKEGRPSFCTFDTVAKEVQQISFSGDPDYGSGAL